MAEKHASQNTVASYRRDVSQFSDYLNLRGLGLLEVDGGIVRDYL